jgi:MoaA/NifB/PqqE/SkfB family radical SAM enzyme
MSACRVKHLNRSLLVFFKNAARVAIGNPAQLLAFLRTLVWLTRAARVRKRWKEQGYLVPPIIIWSITNRCNLHCQGCYNQSFYPYAPGRELSTERLWRLVEEAKDLGVSFFVVAGGEPFLRPELLEITQAYPQMIFLVFTNGSLIDEPVLARLEQQRNLVPLVSLDGDEKETDARRGPGTAAGLKQLMDKMKRRSIFFGSSLTLTRHNFDTLTHPAFVKDLTETGCRFFLFVEYTPVQHGTELAALDEKQWKKVPALMESFRSSFPALFIAVPWDEEEVGGCLSAGRGFVHINAEGQVEPCPFAPFSETSVRDAALKDALQSDFLKRIRERPELARETGGGCVLWENRELVRSLLTEPGSAGKRGRSNCDAR